MSAQEAFRQYYENFEVRPINRSVTPLRGGWSFSKPDCWINKDLSDIIASAPPDDQAFLRNLCKMAAVVGRVYQRQVKDSQTNKIWPEALFNQNGAELLVEAAKHNPSVKDPYCNMSNGLLNPGVPYSRFYSSILQGLNEPLVKAMFSTGSDSSRLHLRYFSALKQVLLRGSENRVSDLPLIRQADLAWAAIPEGVEYLCLTGPIENYDDPLRLRLVEDGQVLQWVESVQAETGLEPWRNFFQCYILKAASGHIPRETMVVVRETTRRLYGKDLPETTEKGERVSLEYRDMLVAAGYGALTGVSGLNLPNFDKLPKYKNIIVMNMLAGAVDTQFVPVIRQAFSHQSWAGDGIAERLKSGRLLLVIGHEENHLFDRSSDGILEEVKSSVRAIKVCREIKRITRQQVYDAILSQVADGMYYYKEAQQAERAGDVSRIGELRTILEEAKIIFNKLHSEGAFVLFDNGKIGDINFPAALRAVISLSDEMDEVVARKIPAQEIRRKYGSNDIWQICPGII